MIRLHATCIDCNGHGVLITGRSGSGKSDLALRLIDRGARLVSDDYTEVEVIDGRLFGHAPREIAGLIEVRGVGIVPMDAVSQTHIALHIVLDVEPPRLPEQDLTINIAGILVPSFALAGLEPSAPIKLEMLLTRILEESA